MKSPDTELVVIVVSARKGGVGKSTIAAHTSVFAGSATVLIDADDQDTEGSSATWMQARVAKSPMFYSYSDYKQYGIDRLLAKAKADGAEVVVIDTPPKADSSITELMRRATVNVVVTEPSFLPLSALPRSLEIARVAGKPTIVVLNKIKAQRLETEQTRAALAELGMPVVELSDLADFGRALAIGQAVHEFNAKSKASEQIGVLWREIKKVIQ